MFGIYVAEHYVNRICYNLQTKGLNNNSLKFYFRAGYGTDAYLHLSRLGHNCENLPDVVVNSPAEGDSTVRRGHSAMFFFGDRKSWEENVQVGLRDDFPRGLGRVVNFNEDLEYQGFDSITDKQPYVDA